MEDSHVNRLAAIDFEVGVRIAIFNTDNDAEKD